MLRRLVMGTLAASALVLTGAPQQALALTSVEGAVIGDQNPYWNVPGQTWFFPHTLGNIDNRVMLQWGSPNTSDNAPSSAVPFFNLLPVQAAEGVGIVFEPSENFNLGLWASRFQNGALNSFAADALGIFGTAGGELATLDAYDPTVNAGRKLDLFASYWLPDSGLELGAHLWWGSGSNSFKLDDSVGPINIDADNDGNPLDDEEISAQDNNKFGLSDFGLGLGAGYTGIPGLRADLGLDLNFLGVSYNPGSLEYADAGGMGLGLNLRAHYDLTEKFQVGGFIGFRRQGLSYEPKRQNDGGELEDFNDDENNALPTPTPTPALPTDDNGEQPAGLKYEQIDQNLQVALLAKYNPISRVKIYGALGYGRLSSTEKLSIGDQWVSETTDRLTSLPFMNLGFEGKVFDWLDVMFGTSKRWVSSTTALHGRDVRIPDDNTGIGGVDPAPGDENNTNENRRDWEQSDSVNTDLTQFMMGTRITYGAFQFVGQMDPDFLLRNVYFISGSSGPTWFWVNLTYDWDYESDIKSGNGSLSGEQMASPHKAEPAAPAPTEAPADSSSEG